ncbi:secreted protein containing N-terminal zinc-dependent carboxypeptidase related domain [Fibrella aestuarina BUZ 2]|uniref:Secreted protein containing N-terminal zinc-dependent carboxypeptidase related domain n=1 Tax=Fibrella aestuarina BUZ 2 TaxID=1166018 RepID=I0KGL4_9BACT|nr:M14 family zinc carboxypeptidase [Fibrella aestuarina]CCH03267.1 secreted protein containing N-terminal zinc-dependent carboxypeptidase related domain [Fibrella aestuarina BUZ 2]
MTNRYINLILCLFTSLIASAQVADSYYLPQTVQYNAAIPTPRQHLGYQVGEWHVSHDQIVGYMKKLDEVSDRITLVEYGRTYESRPLLLLTITSPQNQQQIDRLKAEHVQLADPARSTGLDVSKMPAVVWMGYTVHGNEPSGNNSALLAAYYLAAAQGPAIDSLLNESIILLDPCINPDGANRFANWVNAHKSQNLVSDPASREFNEVWPNGRTNHYWFDLNRDYLYQQHPESQSRMVKFHEWKPNLLTDHHEMGTNSTFFFQPGVPSRTHPLTPRRNVELTNRFGQFQAEGMQRIGSLFYTQENFDDFYYGKGSTYPDVHGCVGILFEQASSRGHAQEGSNGLLTFPFTIRNQFTAMLSTLRAARAMRVDLLNFQRDHYREANADDVRAYVFGNSNDRVRTWEMVNILRRNQVAVYELNRDETLDGRTYTRGNAYLVPLAQPQHRLIRSMFEKRTTFQDSLFYDISAWSMPHCFNVPYSEARTALTPGAKVEANPFPKGRVISGPVGTDYAYLFAWDSYFAPRAASELMRKGYRLKSASQPFSAQVYSQSQPMRFDYGTVQILANGQDPVQLRNLLATLAERDGVDFYAVSSGMTPDGIDLGSDNFKNMRQPRPLLVVGSGVSNLDAGEVWHLLDTRVNVPLSTVDMAQMSRVNLDRYNVLVLVSGDYNGLPTEKIRQWVQNGGTLVAMTDAVRWASEKGLSTARLKRIPTDTTGTRAYADYERYSGSRVIGGAIFQTRADLTHPLLYGYKTNLLSVFKDNTVFLEKSRDPFATPLYYTPTPLVSGYVASANERLFRDTPAIVVNTLGSGRVIAMADNPNFRAFWYGTNKLFLNALFFGNQIGAFARGSSDEND